MAYTDTQISKLRAAAPLNLEKAKTLAAEMGVSHRSIISKAKSLGLEYIKLAPAAKKPVNTVTKAVINNGIRKALGMAEREGDLTKAELENVLAHLG